MGSDHQLGAGAGGLLVNDKNFLPKIQRIYLGVTDNCAAPPVLKCDHETIPNHLSSLAIRPAAIWA